MRVRALGLGFLLLRHEDVTGSLMGGRLLKSTRQDVSGLGVSLSNALCDVLGIQQASNQGSDSEGWFLKSFKHIIHTKALKLMPICMKLVPYVAICSETPCPSRE